MVMENLVINGVEHDALYLREGWKLLWEKLDRFPIEMLNSASAIDSSSDGLYVSSGSVLTKFNFNTRKMWERDLGAAISSITCNDSGCFVSTSNDTLRKFDEQGNQVFQVSQNAISVMDCNDNYIVGISGSNLYVFSSAGMLLYDVGQAFTKSGVSITGNTVHYMRNATASVRLNLATSVKSETNIRYPSVSSCGISETVTIINAITAGASYKYELAIVEGSTYTSRVGVPGYSYSKLVTNDDKNIVYGATGNYVVGFSSSTATIISQFDFPGTITDITVTNDYVYVIVENAIYRYAVSPR